MKAARVSSLAMLLLGVCAFGADEKPGNDDSINVSVTGTLRTGIVAIGGETTGTTISAKSVTFEIDFGKNADLRKKAEKLNGKRVLLRGSLERRAGVEVKERWIITATNID